ncbi:MAG: hypothetical protein JWM47_541 [Acidimicrobiales bacterium]|nr:hypothetical protein [Acidimicrobiales bacterium]
MTGAFCISQPEPGGPAVLWGGVLPAGGLKYLTYGSYVRHLAPGTRGLVEVSGASTALALDALGRERGLATVAVTDPAGEAYLRDHGFGGSVRRAADMGEAQALCQGLVEAGWCWPRQLIDAGMVRHVERWAIELLEQVRASLPAVRHLVSGFGTGASVVGLHRVFAPAGYTVTGIQSAPGRSLPGWRNFATENLGERDLFHRFRSEVPLAVAPDVPGADGLAALLATAALHPQPDQVLVISHDGTPP